MNELQDKAILITRDAQGATAFAEKLAAYNARPIVTPLLTISCIDRVQQTTLPVEIETCEWVFFTSKNGVDCFVQHDDYANALNHCHIAAVGSKTAQALEEFGYTVDFIPSTYNAEVMAKEFLTTYETTKPVLFVRGVLASPILLDAFTKAGRPFYCLEVYETKTNDAMKQSLHSQLTEVAIDYLTFTSPSAVDAFMELVDQPKPFNQLPTVCIGTTTERKALEHGFTETIVPDQFTIEGMIRAIRKDSKKKG